MDKSAIIKRSFSRSKLLDLHDSVARDHLANERTFLAWIRTGFTVCALGIVISRLQLVPVTNGGVDPVYFQILSLLFIVLGIICIFCGTLRYAHVEIAMEAGKYPTSGWLSSVIALLGAGAFVTTFIILLL
jgi:putative membrane protein